MMSLKKVMNNDGDIIIIDSNKEKNRQQKYRHCGTGLPFDVEEYKPEEEVSLESEERDVGESIEEIEDEVELTEEEKLEAAKEAYFIKFGKKAHHKAKLETILEKLAD